MKKFLPWIGLLSRLILGGVLLAAGLLKYQHLDKSQMAVRAYEMLPIALANLLGIILPFLEIAVGVLLVIGAAVRISAIVGGVLMGAFMIGIAQAWARGLSIDCGCFGGGGAVEPGQTKYLQEILRDAGLAFLAAYLIRYPVTKFSVDKKPADSTSQKDVA
jgi:uncharacterized membrane protein YphA (DoxX/SURF4 family)